MLNSIRTNFITTDVRKFDLISIVRHCACLVDIRVSSYLSMVCSDSFLFLAVGLFRYVDWLGGIMDDWQVFCTVNILGNSGFLCGTRYRRHSNQNTCWSMGNSWFSPLQGYEIFLFSLSRLSRLLTHPLATCTWRRCPDSSGVSVRSLTLTSV
jgi:hypothetical protein